MTNKWSVYSKYLYFLQNKTINNNTKSSLGLNKGIYWQCIENIESRKCICRFFLTEGCLLSLADCFLTSRPNFFFLGICSAIQRGRNQDGCEQLGHGDGPQLSAMPIRRPAHHLREYPQGDVLLTNAHRSPWHQLHWRGGLDHRAQWGALNQTFQQL